MPRPADSLLTSLAIAAALTLALTGCTTAPPRDEVVERLLIELETESLSRDHPYNLELAEVMADDALDGECGAGEYWEGLMMAPPSQKQYAWAATCSMYFESEMGEEQVQQAKDLLLASVIDAVDEPEPTASMAAPTSAPPASALATEAVITFYGSDIQVLGSTYDDTPATEDRGRVVGPYSITVPVGVGFYWGAVSWNGAADVGCKVTLGDRVVIDNTGPNQTSATCLDYEGVQ